MQMRVRMTVTAVVVLFCLAVLAVLLLPRTEVPANHIVLVSSSSANAAKGGPLVWELHCDKPVRIREGDFLISGTGSGDYGSGESGGYSSGQRRVMLKVSLNKGRLTVKRRASAGALAILVGSTQVTSGHTEDTINLKPLLDSATLQPGKLCVLARADLVKNGVVTQSVYYYIVPHLRDQSAFAGLAMKEECRREWTAAALGRLPDGHKGGFAPYKGNVFNYQGQSY